MAREENKYLGESGLLSLVEEIKSRFSKLIHSHTLEDITDFKVDTELSIESTNTVQNKIITVEINRINETLSGTAYIASDLQAQIDGIRESVEQKIQFITWEADD